MNSEGTMRDRTKRRLLCPKAQDLVSLFCSHTAHLAASAGWVQFHGGLLLLALKVTEMVVSGRINLISWNTHSLLLTVSHCSF